MPIFVIHKHKSRNLHYDFRLGVGRKLKSWAIPKGPSLNPKDKRLAIPVEDHAMSYANFEGIISPGKYGAGKVMLWDKGTYKNTNKIDGKIVSMQKSIKNGKIEILLKGHKLNGGYALVKMQNRKEWLLVKMNDKEASRKNITRTETRSVLSNKTINQI